MKGISWDRFRRLLQEGRGQGQGRDYQPWIRANRAKSKGYSFSTPGRITGRRHQLLSRIEYGCFLLHDRRRDVADIREQFPLLPLELPIALAGCLGLRAPQSRDGLIHVMTTDFLLDMADGSRLAVAVKPMADLCRRRRAREILAIEKAYWEALSVPFRVVTDKEVTGDMIYNLDALYAFGHPPAGLGDDGIDACMVRLREALRFPGHLSLRARCLDLDATSGLPKTTHFGVVMHLLWKGDLALDLHRRLFPLRPYVLEGDFLVPVGIAGR